MGKHRNYEQQFGEDVRAQVEGPQQRKHWSRHDLRHIRAANDRQGEALRAWFEGDNLGLIGSAGTGKTFLACYMAANALLAGEGIDKIIVVRSAVQGRDQGFMPGTEAEKMSMYEKPYVGEFAKLFGRVRTWEDMKAAGVVQFESTSFLRGITWDSAVVILDEVQNCTFEEINSVCTRIGEGSRLIVAGDTKQIDLQARYKEASGIESMVRIVGDIENFSLVHFTRYDIVRSGFVKSWISACEDYFERNGTDG